MGNGNHVSAGNDMEYENVANVNGGSNNMPENNMPTNNIPVNNMPNNNASNNVLNLMNNGVETNNVLEPFDGNYDLQHPF